MKELVKDIADQIMKNHEWFAYAYPNAFMDSDNGMVLHGERPEYESLAFDDNRGSYFYIRHNSRINYGTAQSVSGCLAAIKKTLPCTLVALLYDGDPYKLEECIVNSLICWRKRSFTAVPTSAIIDTIEVIAAEIKNPDAAEKAYQNIGRHALISISFNLSADYQSYAVTCPCNPCKSGC